MYSRGGYLAFVDFLFILLLSFISMFILALLLINPVVKKSEIERKAEYIIVLEWDKRSDDDVDLWVEDPDGQIVSFRSDTVGVMHLDKDDLGTRNDTIFFPDGTKQIIYLNREVVTLRGWKTGEYTINVHMYRKVGTKPANINVQMIKINPYVILFDEHTIMATRGEERTIRRVTLDIDGVITSTNTLQKKFVNTPLQPIGPGT